MRDTRFHEMPDGRRIAHRFTAGAEPALVFLPGYMSDMAGGKATAVFAWAQAQGRACLLLDYSGCGESAGDFADGTLSRWRDEVVALVEAHCAGPVVLVGSSMGGWLACLTAIDRPERLHALVLIAPAPDFTELLMRPKIPPEGLRELELNGVWMEPSEYDEPLPITAKLLDEGRDHLMLGGTVPIRCPVRILQGQRDEPAPWEHALRLANQLESEDVVFTLSKAGDHRLSTPADIARLIATVDDMRR
jgi:pimeloyl-ACP methyl ester carboxylesterase